MIWRDKRANFVAPPRRGRGDECMQQASQAVNGSRVAVEAQVAGLGRFGDRTPAHRYRVERVTATLS